MSSLGSVAATTISGARVAAPDIVRPAFVAHAAFTVDRQKPGGAVTCQSNGQVPFVVTLGQPLGGRRLVDGTCRTVIDAKPTTFCTNGGVREAIEGVGA